MRLKGSGGFTLLEVLVAVAILGASLAVLLSAVNKGLDLGFKSKNMIIASSLAQRRLAEIELEGYPEPGETSGGFEDAPGFMWYQRATPFTVPELGIEMIFIRLTVSWDEGNENLEVFFAMPKL